MFLYHSTNCLLVLAMLVLPYMPNGPKIIITTSSVTANTAAFGDILST